MPNLRPSFVLASFSFIFTVQVLKSQLFVDKFIETTQYTFIDYISSGFELNFMVAVDFTGSHMMPWTICHLWLSFF